MNLGRSLSCNIIDNIEIRSAKKEDIAAVHAIQVHYVCSTVMNFSYEPASAHEMLQTYQLLCARGYPYLVAISAEVEDDAQAPARSVVGYAYVHPFRERAAYQYTGELSIFCDPKCTGQGVGKALLSAILEQLQKSSKEARELRGGDHEKGSTYGTASEWPREIHQLIVCMSVDSDPEQAEKLRRFYERSGFVQTGYMSKVGWKFGQWHDTRYMQLALQD